MGFNTIENILSGIQDNDNSNVIRPVFNQDLFSRSGHIESVNSLNLQSKTNNLTGLTTVGSPKPTSLVQSNTPTVLKGREGRQYLRNNVNPSLGWSAAGQLVSAGLGVLDSHLGRNDVNLTSKGAQTAKTAFDAVTTGYGLFNTGKTAIGALNAAKAAKTGASVAQTAVSAGAQLSNLASGIAPIVGSIAGRVIGGGNRAFGAGSMAVDAISTGLAFVPGVGPILAGALQLISKSGIGQSRAIKVSDFSSEYASPYAGTAMDNARTISMLSGKKAGTFDFGFKKKADRKLRKALTSQNLALDNVNIGSSVLSAENANITNSSNISAISGSKPQLLSVKHGAKIPELEDIRKLMTSWNNIPMMKNGGVLEKNVIPTGALHKNKHHIEEIRPELEGQITEKGIPVVSSDVTENVEQYAEIEAAEIILSKPVTEMVEDFYKQYKDLGSENIAIELGKFLVDQILYNTIDKDKIIKKTE